VPWQTDTASCRSGYLKTYDPSLPTFWPARVPNQVLTQADYEIVLDPEQPLADRLAAFARRAAWLRPLGSKSHTDQINNMIEETSITGDLAVSTQRLECNPHATSRSAVFSQSASGLGADARELRQFA
jgi:hypothetical protein